MSIPTNAKLAVQHVQGMIANYNRTLPWVWRNIAAIQKVHVDAKHGHPQAGYNQFNKAKRVFEFKCEPTPEKFTHASPRPHIRAAHWHTFLTGSRLNPQPRVRWLPPILVNTRMGDIEPVVRPVVEELSHQ